MSRKESSSESETEQKLDEMPSALVTTIMTKLDVASICSMASTCRAFNSCASQILSSLPSFHLLDTASSLSVLQPLLLPNPYLRSLKLDCGRLDDNAIGHLISPSLQELALHNCKHFSGRLLSEIGGKCKQLRSLYLESVAENRSRVVYMANLEELLSGCSQLEVLILLFDFSFDNFAQVWALASDKLSSLEIGFVSSAVVTELLSPNRGPPHPPNSIRPSVLPNIQKLSLSVDYITDHMVGTVATALSCLTHLELQDAPIIKPRATFDLTNSGLQQINQHKRLKHLSLVRSQKFQMTYFRRVNDLGVLLIADRCANMESICLGGFCRVTDTCFKTLLHSCSNLYRLRISHGTQLTDLAFHDISATSLSLTHVSLRWCNLITNCAVQNLVANKNLTVLDLRDCRNIGDEALQAISTLLKLKILLLDGSDITDVGLLYLKEGVIKSLTSLSVRGCKKLTDKWIYALSDGSTKLELQELDMSNLPNLSDKGVILLAKCRLLLRELRIRQCPLIGDISVIKLALMKVDDERWHGSSIRLLDIYNCGGITHLAFKWLKKPYFPRLRWLGVARRVNRFLVLALAVSRKGLKVAYRGEELRIQLWDKSDGQYMHDYSEMDESEQGLKEAEDESEDE